MKQPIRHGAVIKCEVPGCLASFTTYSVSSLARQQAADAGWVRVKGTTVRIPDVYLGRGKVDICPEHKPKPVMEGSHP